MWTSHPTSRTSTTSSRGRPTTSTFTSATTAGPTSRYCACSTTCSTSSREQYERTSDLDPGKETITAHYPWYYLNTYVTNVVDGRVYVVDGQQRLTTLSLILIKLHHLAKLHGSKLAGWLDTKIAGQSGFEQSSG